MSFTWGGQSYQGITERPYIWGGVIAIGLGTLLWLFSPSRAWLGAVAIVGGTVAWLYGDRKAKAI